jgi:hypothetical protein
MLTARLTWNSGITRREKELPRDKWDGGIETSWHGRQWVVVKQQILASVECVKFQGISNKIVEEDGKNALKWYFCKRNQKSFGKEENSTAEEVALASAKLHCTADPVSVANGEYRS